MNNHSTSLEFSHFPVMLNEVLKITSPSTKKKFIDPIITYDEENKTFKENLEKIGLSTS